MGAIRRTLNGYLYFDFRARGLRCREYTQLTDTPANRKKMAGVLAKIEAEITLGQFNYLAYFPAGSRVSVFGGSPGAPAAPATAFEVFARQWYDENKACWKPSVAEEFHGTLEKHLVPAFKGREVTALSASDIKQFRAALARLPGRKGQTLSNKRINNILVVLRLILSEASERFGTPNPSLKIKPLRVEKADIHPFTPEEVKVFFDGVRPDFYNYYFTRFTTGMRPGEIDALEWEHVDWVNRKVMVRQAIYRRRLGTPKTKGSVRDIDLLPPTLEVLRRQFEVTGHRSNFVFCNQAARSLDASSVTKRVWYPTLARLNLARRTPYQTRHTAATLWLAAGENPEWIAKQLGHSNTDMLFRVYSRFVPNLTRRDGAAFLRILKRYVLRPSLPQVDGPGASGALLSHSGASGADGAGARGKAQGEDGGASALDTSTRRPRADGVTPHQPSPKRPTRPPAASGR